MARDRFWETAKNKIEVKLSIKSLQRKCTNGNTNDDELLMLLSSRSEFILQWTVLDFNALLEKKFDTKLVIVIPWYYYK